MPIAYDQESLTKTTPKFMQTHSIMRLSEIKELSLNFGEQYAPLSIIFDIEPCSFDFSFSSKINRHTEGYLSSREDIWLKKKNNLGHFLWNGVLLSAVRLDLKDGNVSLTVAECEFKDALYKSECGIELLRKKHPEDNIDVHTFTAVLPVLNNKYVLLSKIGPSTAFNQGLLDMIGGSLNLDEEKIGSLKDISKFTRKELLEEINISITPDELSLFSINYHAGVFFFLYKFHLDDIVALRDFEKNNEVEAVVVHNINGPVLEEKSVTSDLMLSQHTFRYLVPSIETSLDDRRTKVD